MSSRRRQLYAFTLIEMIGVLAVIAILASLLIPKIFESINNSRLGQAQLSYQTVKTAVRSVINRVTLQALLTGRTFVNETLQRIVDDETEPWGVKVSSLELKEVQLRRRPSARHGWRSRHPSGNSLQRCRSSRTPSASATSFPCRSRC